MRLCPRCFSPKTTCPKGTTLGEGEFRFVLVEMEIEIARKTVVPDVQIHCLPQE